MQEKSSQPQEKRMTFTFDAVRDEMRQHVRSVAALAPDDSRKAGLAFAANALRLPFVRVKKLFYGECQRIDAHEADQIRAYVHAAHKMIEARADYERQRREFLAEAHPAVLRMAQVAGLGEEVSEVPTQAQVNPRAARR